MIKGTSWILEASDLSLNDRMNAVRQAVSAKYNQAPGDYSYCEVVFDDYVILSKGGKLWRVGLTFAADGTVTLTGEPVQVRVTYTPVSESTRFEGQVMNLLPDTDGRELKEGEAAKPPSGRRWGVVIIQEGMSKNRNRYGRKVLQEAAPLYEGAKIYENHLETQPKYGRKVGDTIGFLKDVQPCLLNSGTQESEADPIFALAATAVITKAAIRQEMLEAYEEGNANLFGLSHDAMCRSVTVIDEHQIPFYDVTKIESVSSVDLVTNPAAGGRVLRLVASDTVPHTLTEDGNMLKKMIESIKASGNAEAIRRLEGLGATPNEDQVLAIYSDAMKGVQPVAAPKTEGTAAPAAGTPAVTAPGATGTGTAAAPAAAATTGTPAAAVQTTEAAAGTMRQVSEAEWRGVLVDGRTSFLESALAGCALHATMKDRIRKRFVADMAAGNIPTKEAILAAIKEDVEFFGQAAEAGLMLPAAGMPRFEGGKAKRDKVVEALDDFFGVKADSKVRGGYRVAEGSEQKLMSFRNLYVEITGDVNVTGRKSEATRLTESLDSTSFDQILGDSITRRMVAEYAMGSQAQWRGTIAEVVPVSDFRTQRRMRFGGYGNLSTVVQGAPYPAMTSPTDEEATYAAAKRGGTEQLTIEMIANDDVGAIRRIPQKMARAAAQTLYEFVFDFMRTNAAIYDTVALAAAGHNNNISTTALSNTQLNALRLAIKTQTDMSNGKRIGLPARYLFVPTDLEELAFWLCTSDRALPDSSIPSTAASGAPNFQRKLGIQPITVDYWTDTNNYWLTSSVQDTPMIEIGFLGGREEPELFVQDQPNQGSLFSNDVITYKIRHIYGGAVLDFRGFAGGIVA